MKVWFQNRRTKHKRVQQEGDDPAPGSKKSGGSNNAGSSDQMMSDDEDNSDIDLEVSDDEDFLHHPSANPQHDRRMIYSWFLSPTFKTPRHNTSPPILIPPLIALILPLIA